MNCKFPFKRMEPIVPSISTSLDTTSGSILNPSRVLREGSQDFLAIQSWSNIPKDQRPLPSAGDPYARRF